MPECFPARVWIANVATPCGADLQARANRRMMANATNDVLLTAGAASVILAVVGGGARAFGVEVPVLDSIRRQVGLAVVGVAFIVAAVVFADGGGGNDGSSHEVKVYRQQVLASCRALPRDALPPLDNDGSISRDAFIAWARGQVSESEQILSALWKRDVPGDLAKDADQTHGDADALASATDTALDRLEAALPSHFSVVLNPPQPLRDFNGELAGPSATFEASMSALADAPCRPISIG